MNIISAHREAIVKKTRLVVIKIGSGVIKGKDNKGLSSSVIGKIVNQISLVIRENIHVVIVSSGAIAAGITELHLEQIPDDIPQKQAAAAIGQTHLIGLYEKYFKKNELRVAQILLTHDDLSQKKRYLNAKNTISIILSRQVIPIINENDTVAVEEIRFGDNDTLSAMVATLIGANLLIILSDVDGLFTKDPTIHLGSQLIDMVPKITPKIERLARESNSSIGVGGMITKIKAAKIAASAKIPTIIVNGKKRNIISKIMDGEKVGTVFLA